MRRGHRWPPDPGAANVFFGGSTGFGLGLADAQTVPARLQEMLTTRIGRPVVVYDFARPGYYSSQERVLFEQLLLSGNVPKAAVFLDGLNEGLRADGPRESPWWGTLLSTSIFKLVAEDSERRTRGRALSMLRDLPITRELRRRAEQAASTSTRGRSEPSRQVERWRLNARLESAAAREVGVKVLWVWQPVSAFAYDASANLFAEDALRFPNHASEIYPVVRGLVSEHPDEWKEALWLGEMQAGRHENLYVDGSHYSAAFADEIAARIADRVVADRLLDGAAR